MNGYLALGIIGIVGLILATRLSEVVPFLAALGLVGFLVVFVFPHVPAVAP